MSQQYQKQKQKWKKQGKEELIKKIKDLIECYENADNSAEQLKIELDDKQFWNGVNCAFENITKNLKKILEDSQE